MPKTRKVRKSTPKKRTRPGTKKTLSLKTLLVVAVLFVLLGLGLYSYQQYKTSQIEQKGLVVCSKEGVCEKSMHIHSALQISICGQERSLAKDTGELADIHTHKQSNVLHFHERLRVTPQGEVLDWEPLTLKNAVESTLGMKLTDECIGEFCNGKACPNGKRGTLTLTTVGGFCEGDSCPGPEAAEKALEELGKQQENIGDYVWQDGDLLNLTFE